MFIIRSNQKTNKSVSKSCHAQGIDNYYQQSKNNSTAYAPKIKNTQCCPYCHHIINEDGVEIQNFPGEY
jgi:hypothetical protein